VLNNNATILIVQRHSPSFKNNGWWKKVDIKLRVKFCPFPHFGVLNRCFYKHISIPVSAKFSESFRQKYQPAGSIAAIKEFVIEYIQGNTSFENLIRKQLYCLLSQI